MALKEMSHREYVDELPIHLRIGSKFRQDATGGKTLSTLQLAFEAMGEQGANFWHLRPSSGEDDNGLPFVITGPNGKVFAETFSVIQRAYAAVKWDRPYLNVLQQSFHFGESGRSYFDQEKTRGMFITPEAMEQAPESLKELIGLIGIPQEKFTRPEISTEGIPAQISNFGNRVEIGIGSLHQINFKYDRQLVLSIDLAGGWSGLELSFFAGTYTPSKEVVDHLQSFCDEAKRADLFNALGKFMLTCIHNPNIVVTPWSNKTTHRWYEKTAQSAYARAV